MRNQARTRHLRSQIRFYLVLGATAWIQSSAITTITMLINQGTSVRIASGTGLQGAL
jgi:hypothetical protein